MTETNDTNTGLPADQPERTGGEATGDRRVAGPDDSGAGVRRGVSRDEWFKEREDERRAAGREAWLRQHEGERRAGTGDDRPDPLSSAAHEAWKLFDSLQQRMGRELGKGFVKGGVTGLGQGLGQALGGGKRSAEDVWAEVVAGHDDDEYICRACPVCRLKAARREAARREAGGDVTDHLIAAGGELFAAFRQAVDAVSRPAAPSHEGDRDTRVEHIDLG